MAVRRLAARARHEHLERLCALGAGRGGEPADALGQLGELRLGDQPVLLDRLAEAQPLAQGQELAPVPGDEQPDGVRTDIDDRDGHGAIVPMPHDVSRVNRAGRTGGPGRGGA